MFPLRFSLTLFPFLRYTKNLCSFPSTVNSTTTLASVQTSLTSLRRLVRAVNCIGWVTICRIHFVCWEPMPNMDEDAVWKQQQKKHIKVNGYTTKFWLSFSLAVSFLKKTRFSQLELFPKVGAASKGDNFFIFIFSKKKMVSPMKWSYTCSSSS